MKSYSELVAIVDGRTTNKLEIFHDSTGFHAFEYDVNVFSTGSWVKMNDYCKGWKEDFLKLAKALIERGMIKEVSFIGEWGK